MLQIALRYVTLTCTLIFCLACSDFSAQATLVIIDGKVYTASAKQRFAEAVAITDDRIVFVGDTATAKSYIGPSTQVINARGMPVLPGLHDIHIHPFGLISNSNCDLQSQALSLAELSTYIRQCIEDAQLPNGEWLTVDQWNFTKGNTPDTDHPTLRAALDRASNQHPIFLRGNDGHHGGANSQALASAQNTAGETVGISRDTIARHFSDFRQYIGLDSNGEPDGNLSEGGRYLLGLASEALTGDGNSEQLAAKLPKINYLLNSRGITSIQDAAAEISTFAQYEAYAKSGQQSYRLTAALFTDFAGFARPLTTPTALAANGEVLAENQWIKQNALQSVNIHAVIKHFTELRDRQLYPELLKANAAKLFVDGVIEGNPYATPPALPNAAVYRPYLQPQFSLANDALALDGYVDPLSMACRSAALDAGKLERRTFITQHGFYPEQCEQSKGRLEHDANFIKEYIYALEAAGFAVHAHAIGDRAVGEALRVFQASRKRLGHTLPQTIAHVQQVAPHDLPLLRENPVFLTFTFAWAVPDYLYDVTVTPFIDRVANLQDLYRPSHYAMRQHYPVQSAMQYGATLTAGSDAPVDTRDPRPFTNIAAAVTRAAENRIYNASERLDILDVLDAYTINGAKALQQDTLTGSIEIGKKADLIILDRDIFQDASDLNGSAISGTQVLTTLFDGRVVYTHNNN